MQGDVIAIVDENVNTVAGYVYDAWEKPTIKSNRKKESKLTYTDGYINNQAPLTDWKLGYEKLSECGCEVISVYNALKACGKTYKLSELILYFEVCGYVIWILRKQSNKIMENIFFVKDKIRFVFYA